MKCCPHLRQTFMYSPPAHQPRGGRSSCFGHHLTEPGAGGNVCPAFPFPESVVIRCHSVSPRLRCRAAVPQLRRCANQSSFIASWSSAASFWPGRSPRPFGATSYRSRRGITAAVGGCVTIHISDGPAYMGCPTKQTYTVRPSLFASRCASCITSAGIPMRDLRFAAPGGANGACASQARPESVVAPWLILGVTRQPSCGSAIVP